MCIVNLFTEIADAIRSKKGTTDKIIAEQFPNEINSIVIGGLDTSDATATASDILKDKTAYVKGVKIIGTLQTGGGSTVVEGVKQFYTIDEMNSTTGEKGDLAIVYTKTTAGITVNDTIQKVILPSTVVLDAAITTTISCIFKSEPDADGNTYQYTFTLNKSRLSYRDNTNMTNVTLYNSSDGITYTRNSKIAENYDFGVGLTPAASRWNDNLSSFFRMEIAEFNGLFEYNEGWKVATNQFTAEPVYVFNKSFMGKNGVESGTMQTTTELSLNDFAEKVIIYSTLSEMTPAYIDSYDSFSNLIKSNKEITKIKMPKGSLNGNTKIKHFITYCDNLTSIDMSDFDISGVQDMQYAFAYNTSLVDIKLPENVTSHSNGLIILNMFKNDTSLSDESLNEIMRFIIDASPVNDTKTLANLGLTQEQATRCRTLSNWQGMAGLGWTIGY